MSKFKILFLLLIFVGPISEAQNTTSPYSIFGPGEIQAKGFGRSIGMGNAGIALKSGVQLNNLNPASYVGIDSMHFIYEIGIEGKYSKFYSQGKSQNALYANLKYLAMGFRVTNKWSVSLGVTPFSNVGYNILSQNYVEGSNLTYTSKYSGSGGINQAYMGNSLKLGKNLSIGLNVSYMFGSLVQEELITQTIMASYIIDRTDYLHSFYFDYGLQYSFKPKKLEYSMGLIFSNRQNLKSKHAVSISDIDYNLIQSWEEETDHLKVPSTYGIGFGIKNTDRLTLAADYKFQNWSDVKYPTQIGDFTDSHEFSLGTEFKPWPQRLSNAFFKNWTYRAGCNYQSSYLKVGNRILDDKNVSIGLGIPLKNNGSQINIAFKYGSKGTTLNNQIKENYFLFHINFSMNEIWFFKKKYF